MEPHYIQPDIYLSDVRITEPSIALTSLIITLLCAYAWWRLRRPVQTDTVRLIRIFLLTMGLSTLAGGLAGHAFLYCLPFVAKLPGWTLGMLAVSALEQASIVRARPYLGRRWARSLFIINVLELTLALIWVVVSLQFPVVEVHSAFGLLLIVCPLEAWLLYKTRQRSSRFMLLAIGFAALAVVPQVAKFSLDTWFTYFDIGHVLMCGTIWLIMRAGEVGAVEEAASS